MSRVRMLAVAVLSLAVLGATASWLPAQVPTDSAPRKPAAVIPGRPLEGRAAGGAVVVRGDTVLIVPAPLGAFTPDERALAIKSRFNRLSRVQVESLDVVTGDLSTDLVAGDLVLMTVTDADAEAAGVTRPQLVQAFRTALVNELDRISLAATLKVVAIGLLQALLATAALVVLVVLLRRGTGRLEKAVEARRGTTLPRLRIRTIELVSAEQIATGLLAAIRGIRFVGMAVLLYFYLPLVLSFFPWTRQYSDRLVGYIVEPLLNVLQAIAAFLPNLVFIVVIVVVTRQVLRLVRLVFGAMGSGALQFSGFERDWADPTYKIVRFLIIAFVAVVMFPYLPGAQSDAFKGVSLFLGILVSFGSSSAIANIVAGVVLTYTRAFNVGDRVRIGDTVGDVVAKRLLVTRVRTIKRVDVTIPNAMVLSTHVSNYTAMAADGGVILFTAVTIGYDAPWRQVHQLLISAALATPDILQDPKPFVLQTSLDDFYVRYELNAYTASPQTMASTYSALHANIQDRFNEAGVEILSPHYRGVRDGNTITIPAEQLPAGYEPPSFRVRINKDAQ